MRKFTNFKCQLLLLGLSGTFYLAACNNSSNSNVGVLYRNSPTPAATEIERAATVEPSPTAAPTPPDSPAAPDTSPAPAASPLPLVGTDANDPFVNSSENKNSETGNVTSSEKLMVPVLGVRTEDLRDTFDAARSEGRVHDAIDIMAAGGTPVVAATDGKIVKFFDSVRGGITIYQLSPDERTVYYYAHLQRRADNLREGDTVKQGALLGYVGDTGNSGTGNFHLHFAIWTITDPKRFYDGTNINPYPLLKNGIVKSQ